MEAPLVIVLLALAGCATLFSFALLFAIYSVGTASGMLGRRVAHGLATLVVAALVVGGLGIFATPANGLGVAMIALALPVSCAWFLVARLTRRDT